MTAGALFMRSCGFAVSEVTNFVRADMWLSLPKEVLRGPLPPLHRTVDFNQQVFRSAPAELFVLMSEFGVEVQGPRACLAPTERCKARIPGHARSSYTLWAVGQVKAKAGSHFSTPRSEFANCTTQLPSRTMSAGVSAAHCTGMPLTSTPLVQWRSSMCSLPSRSVSRAWRRLTEISQCYIRGRGTSDVARRLRLNTGTQSGLRSRCCGTGSNEHRFEMQRCFP